MDRVISERFLDEIITALVAARHPEKSFRDISAMIAAIHKLPNGVESQAPGDSTDGDDT